MEENPYKAPLADRGAADPRPVKWRRKRTILGYALAALAGFFLVAPAILWFTAELDDSGGVQAIIGVLLCVVIPSTSMATLPINDVGGNLIGLVLMAATSSSRVGVYNIDENPWSDERSSASWLT